VVAVVAVDEDQGVANVDDDAAARHAGIGACG